MDCISNREMGNNRGFQNMRLTSEYATRHMLSNAMMKECPVSQQHMNKVIYRYLVYVTYPIKQSHLSLSGFLQPVA